MTRPDDDWNALAAVWTAPDDAPQLTAGSVRRRALLGRLNFHIELGGSLIAGAAGGWFAVRHGSPVLGVAAAAFAAFALAGTLWARRGAEPSAMDTPRAALEAALLQARSGLRWARAGQAICVAALLFLTVVAAAHPSGGSLVIYLASGVFLAVTAGFYERHARRSRRRMSRHATALRDLDGT